MIDHLAMTAPPELLEKAVEFYARTLEPLGYKKQMEVDEGRVIGFGDGPEGPQFWIAVLCPKRNPEKHVPNFHFAFRAKDRKTVDDFYAKAIEAGGKDNGAPGLRPHYHPNYYGAFIYDPVGNGIEAVCHAPA